MFCHDFRVHRARVFLFLMLLLMFVVVARAIEVNRPYLDAIPNYFITGPSGRMTLP